MTSQEVPSAARRSALGSIEGTLRGLFDRLLGNLFTAHLLAAMLSHVVIK